MAITKNSARQYPLVATVDFVGGTDVTTAGAYAAIDVPAGAIVTGGYVVVDTAFTALVDIDVGDGGDPDRYTNAVINADSTGRTALNLTGYQYPANDTIDITIATATATAGAATLVVEYIIDGRDNENFG